LSEPADPAPAPQRGGQAVADALTILEEAGFVALQPRLFES